MTVYLIHFDTKLANHAQHYLGWADDLQARLECHRRGNGARLMAVITEKGIGWRLARTWPGHPPAILDLRGPLPHTSEP